MSVKINIPSYFQYFTENTQTVEVEGHSIKECLEMLTKRFPGLEAILFDTGKELKNSPLSYVAIFLNGVAVRPEEIDGQVNDGDELELNYVILGG